MEIIAREGTTWTRPTWAPTTPKLLYDGKKLYAVNLVGSGPGRDVARLYWRDSDGWHEGANITPVYQPATILLDSGGHINLFCTESGLRGCHWRSIKPGDVTAFEQVPLAEPEKFAFGYLGIGSCEDMLVLVGLDTQYAMWIALKPSSSEPWDAPRPLAPSRLGEIPRISPVYPVVMPERERVHVVYSNCPDGGEGNTYNRVQYALLDIRQDRVVRRDVIADGPLGEVTYEQDALLSPDGTLYVLYTAGVYKYSERRNDIEGRKGLYCAVLRPGQHWFIRRLSDNPSWGQLCAGPGGDVHVFSESRHFVSRNRGKSWEEAGPRAPDPAGQAFYVIKANSGSVVDGAARMLLAERLGGPLPAGASPFILKYAQVDLSSP